MSHVLVYITCVMLCYMTCVVLCYITGVMLYYVLLKTESLDNAILAF